MSYKLFIAGFQKEFNDTNAAGECVKQLVDAGLYYINADEVKKGKGELVPTVFVKGQNETADTLEDAAASLTAYAKVFADWNIQTSVQLKTIA